ncbi:MAG: hypothetical protein HS108_05530 [Planctomycetes bacterium]|nr:hypothetical protein [Planctomycetota bacterium]MCL4731098.1 hypothetical protein [Planctomycetota bacterium]
MHALLALSAAFARDQLRRASTLVLAGVGLLMILSLRWFSAFGLGYEVVQLKEMGVYSIGLLSAVAVLLFLLPRDDEPAEGIEPQLLARPVAPHILAGGVFLGRAGCLAGLCLLWTLGIYAALWWFQWTDPRLFGYRGATSALDEGHAVLVPVLAQWVSALILLALAQPLARTRRPAWVACGVVLLYLGGYAVAGLGEPWARLLPDLSRHDITQSLWGGQATPVLPLLVHGLAWCAVGLAIDSGILRARVAS